VKKLFFALFFYFAAFCSQSVYAQNPAPPDTTLLTEYAFIPAASYNTDFGFIFGGLVSRYDYSKGILPYTSLINLNSVISTEGLFQLNLNIDLPKAFDRNLRLTHFLEISRFFEDNYFGIARNEELNPSFEDNPDLYTFNSFRVSSELQVRLPIRYYTDINRLEFIYTNLVEYQTPFENDADRLISLQRPTGFEGGLTNLMLVGLILERRDDEIRMTKGTFTKITSGGAVDGLLSDYTLMQHAIEHRSYFTFHWPLTVTFANRIWFRNSSGDDPYWILPRMGGELTLRGFPDKRFINENFLLINTELRSWLGTFPILETEFGGAFFMDAGRSFSNNEFDSITEDILITGGISGFMSLFTEDFFLRGDLGLSREGFGIYVGVGFLF
jgi:hypothetical protein